MECANCGKEFDAVDLVDIGGKPVCVTCKPAAISKIREGNSQSMKSSATEYVEYAGFWIRVGAKMIDGLIMGAVSTICFMIIGVIAGVLIPSLAQHLDFQNSENQEAAIGIFIIIYICFLALSIIGPVVYNSFFLVKSGATPGKMACGLKVINADGSEKISVGKAIGRSCGEIVSGMVLYIGYIIVGFDDEKRSLHDHMANTRVIKK